MFSSSEVMGVPGGEPVSLEDFVFGIREGMRQQSSTRAEDLLDNHEGDSPKVLEQTQRVDQLPYEDGAFLHFG